MRRSVLFLSIFILFLAIACSKRPESEATVEIIDGIEAYLAEKGFTYISEVEGSLKTS